jgi:hypothetical protein
MRRHFCVVVARVKGRCPLPRNMALNWFIPAPVNSSVGSFWGTRLSLGYRVWPRASKKAR